MTPGTNWSSSGMPKSTTPVHLDSFSQKKKKKILFFLCWGLDFGRHKFQTVNCLCLININDSCQLSACFSPIFKVGSQNVQSQQCKSIQGKLSKLADDRTTAVSHLKTTHLTSGKLMSEDWSKVNLLSAPFLEGAFQIFRSSSHSSETTFLFFLLSFLFSLSKNILNLVSGFVSR